jgi:hypothetical protein
MESVFQWSLSKLMPPLLAAEIVVRQTVGGWKAGAGVGVGGARWRAWFSGLWASRCCRCWRLRPTLVPCLTGGLIWRMGDPLAFPHLCLEPPFCRVQH